MTFRRAACVALVLLVATVTFVSGAEAAGPSSAPERPSLLVLLVFDQMRGDYLTRWDELFCDGGFRRLAREGAWYRNCHYPYALTVTGAGHASLATGRTPAAHGIIGNEWYDRKLGRLVNCVESPDATGPSPGRLLCPTLADLLKAGTGGRARVVSLSLKDRSAILPGGRSPNACYWFASANGRFVASPYYRGEPQAWVTAFNESDMPNRWAGTSWTRLVPDADYARHLAGGSDGVAARAPFALPLAAGGKAYGEALAASPFGNDMLWQFARRAIEAERLGRRDTTDLLCVSFSSNDLVGHRWGPDSEQVLDMTLRSDRLVETILRDLDAAVGRGRYALALSSDHGVCPVPEEARARGLDAGRLNSDHLRAAADAYLSQAHPGAAPGPWLKALVYPWVYLNDVKLRSAELDSGDVAAEFARWAERQPGMRRAYTRQELGRPASSGEDEFTPRIRASFHPERSGDVYLLHKPYWIAGPEFGPATGTTHGTPYDYDTHVPLLFLGPGLPQGVKDEPVSPLCAAAALLSAAGLDAPAGLAAPPAKSAVPDRAGH